MSKYAIIIEKAKDNYSAYLPDIPGCIATGATMEDTKEKMLDALMTHLELMRAAGEPIPQPETYADYVEVG